MTGEIIGLHYAQRYGEANQLIKNYPGLETELQISKQLNQEREKSVTERTENKQDRDYQLNYGNLFFEKIIKHGYMSILVLVRLQPQTSNS